MSVKILLAPDKFRGSFSSAEVCAHLARGMTDASLPPRPATVESLPLADGGEGTLDAILRARGGSRVEVEAHGPLDEEILGSYGVTLDGTAVIESATFCGLGLVPAEERNPMLATSYGLGETIASALDAGLLRFLIGLGGTATVDGGAGMARALGYRFIDASGHEIGGRGKDLSRIVSVDASMVHPLMASASFTALCDVEIPLLGPRGAARLFGPQKGASEEQVAELERGLGVLQAALAARQRGDTGWAGKLAGAGAGGGLGAGAAAFLNASLKPGAVSLMEMMGFAGKLAACSLVVTGEGSFDSQSLYGKVTGAVLDAAARAGKPVVVVAGSWDGTLPTECSSSVQVLTGQDLPSRPHRIAAADLAALGRAIVLRARTHSS